MPTLREYRDSRLKKLHRLKALGVNAYPSISQRTNLADNVLGSFKKFEGKTVKVAGRILAMRGHGKLQFMDIRDSSGILQAMLRVDGLLPANHKSGQLNFSDLELLDLGDFVEIEGCVTKTKKGEVTVMTKHIRLLTKALRPMPSSWGGLKDKETRLRRRYLDTNMNPDVYQRFFRRSKFWQATRDFLLQQGFVEINIPVLEHTTGGADANPFVTHMGALDEDFYLRISHELPLKRLIGGGYEKVFDIGPRFRNENYSDEHLPEHVAMEFYWAYADWRQGMQLVEELIKTATQAAFGKYEFEYKGHKINLGKDWLELDFAQLMHKHYKFDVRKPDLATVQGLLKANKIETSRQDNLARGIDKLWKHVRRSIAGPVFVTGIPKLLSPLAKTNPDNPDIAERFWPIIAGTEMGTGWSELNDPQEQLDRFKEQQALREAGDEEAQMLDIDYVEMLEYGMPPTFGYGYSERLFWALEGVSAREGVPFPQLRRETDQVTKSVYPELFKGKK